MELLIEAAKPMVQVMVSRVIDEIGLLGFFKEELNKVQDKIQIIGSIVLNINTCTNDKAVEVWLRKIFPIIHNLENLLDILAYEKQHAVVMKNKSQKSIIKKFKRSLIVSPLERIDHRRKIGKWIKKINGDIEEALEYASTIVSLKALVRSSTFQVSRYTRDNVATDCLQDVRRNADTSMVVGRDKDVDSLVRDLCNPFQDRCHVSRHGLSVVAIVGLGGIGKTTLAKNVYNNEEVKSYFSEQIWITISQDFNIDENLNKMVEFLKGSHNDKVSSEIAIRNLGERLAGKRYLLVMDDVWNTNPLRWDAMRNALERIGGSMDSMILATTRDDRVATTMNALFSHRLLELSEDDGWLLFEQIVFANRSQEDVSIFKPIAKAIYTKCRGVPLAIKTVSGILRTKSSILEWEDIDKSELWELHDDTGILPSLKLSYNHLPSSFIKKCFSLCAFVPKGFWFEKYELIDRWNALGLIQQSSNNKLVEDIGEEYFTTLVSISFILVCDTDEFGEAIYYTMHDLVYDLARSVAKYDRLYLEVDKNDNNALDIQHLTMVGHCERAVSNFPNNVLENLRSLDIFRTLPDGLLMHLRYLRVLSMCNIGLEEVPVSVSQLKCLKLLDLMKNPIIVLPGCIMELYNLQSLLLYDCELLSELPEGLGCLVNLRHLGLSYYFSPTQGTIRQLTHLQILPPLQLSEGGLTISELGCLHNIRGKIEIKGLEFIKSKQDAEMANLKMKTKVKELRLKWENKDDITNHVEVLNALYPNTLLKVLSINGYAGETFPSWLMNSDALCNLQKIELLDCGGCSELPTLGNLPSLKLLHISKMENVERISPEFYCDYKLSLGNKIQAASSSSSFTMKSKIYFPSLKEFRLNNLPKLVEWCEPRSEECMTFQSLKELVMEDCPSLKSTPSNFPSLEQLTVRNINSETPLSKILSNKSSLTYLKNLHIGNVEGLRHLPKGFTEYCKSLHTLRIFLCKNLTCLPESLSKLKSLELLEISACVNLMSFPDLSGLGLLRELEISCLISVPTGIQSCYSLEKLWVYLRPMVQTLPNLTGLTRLSNLAVWGMTKFIRQPPDWLYNLSTLQILHIGGYEELNEFPDISFLLKMTSLKALYVYGWETIKSIPTQLKLFTRLEYLAICSFNHLESVPDWIQNLSSLETFSISSCEKVKELPSTEAMNHLTKLRYIFIKKCPLLTEYDKIPPHIKVEIM